jgi:hypothetical protein
MADTHGINQFGGRADACQGVSGWWQACACGFAAWPDGGKVTLRTLSFNQDFLIFACGSQAPGMVDVNVNVI